MWQNLLRTVFADDRPQHLVAIDQFLPCSLHQATVIVGNVEFKIDVTANIAELEIAGAAEPIGSLHIGQRKGLITGRTIGSE